MLKSKFKAPDLCLPEAESAKITEVYTSAKVILEYGSGGSTMLAARQPGMTLFSVESDAKWAADMEAAVQAANGPGTVHMHPVDIGKTKQWGYPRSDKGWAGYPDYCLSVWDRPDFVQPEVVFIDGRFRVGCFLATVMRTEAPVTLFFDDYHDRAVYEIVETFAPRVASYGRLAEFEITPGPIPKDRILEIMKLMQAPL